MAQLGPDYGRLKSSLSQSKEQKDNPALYQTILGLINGMQLFQENILAALNSIVVINTVVTPNAPTANEKAALVGSFGAPSSTNVYVTDSDPRLTANILGTPGPPGLDGEDGEEIWIVIGN
jgi:hypothetical protein